MICNQPLTLPAPFAGSWVIDHINECKRNRVKTRIDGYSFIDNDLSILNPELLEIFSSLGLKPNIMLILGHAGVTNFQIKRHFVHADTVWHDQQWKKQPLAINWELTDGEAMFYWWDTEDTPEFYPLPLTPEQEKDIVFSYAKGIYYGKQFTDFQSHIQENPPYKLVDQVKIVPNAAVAINTSVPHSACATIREQSRCALSIRFPLEQIPTWEHGIELFRNHWLSAQE